MRRSSPLPSIFVAIASFRDPECQWTVRDLYCRAAHPERIFVGIAWQFVPGEDDHCFLVETFPAQVRAHMVAVRDSQGMCWARTLAHDLWQGEDFVLQIDSHTRFHDNWDETLLSEWQRCPSVKAALSAYPASYTPPRVFSNCFTSRIVCHGDRPGGWLRPRGETACLSVPERGVHFAGGFIFAPAALFREVLYDPEIDTLGEELCFSARAWTHGWDPYAPSVCILHHYYNRISASMPEGPEVERRAESSAKRVAALLRLTDDTRPLCIVNISPDAIYGWGAARPFEQWCDEAGFAPRNVNI